MSIQYIGLTNFHSTAQCKLSWSNGKGISENKNLSNFSPQTHFHKQWSIPVNQEINHYIPEGSIFFSKLIPNRNEFENKWNLLNSKQGCEYFLFYKAIHCITSQPKTEFFFLFSFLFSINFLETVSDVARATLAFILWTIFSHISLLISFDYQLMHFSTSPCPFAVLVYVLHPQSIR